MKEDLYKTLDINETATKKDIKKAYRTKAKTHHPDQGGNSDKFADEIGLNKNYERYEMPLLTEKEIGC